MKVSFNMHSTIKDVARLAKVSIATVSRVINEPNKVKESTYNSVREAMLKCNYTYNMLARGFITKESLTIGLIIPSITNPIFAESTIGIEDYLRAHRYSVILGNSEYNFEIEKNLVDTFRERRVDGIILTTSNVRDNEFFEKLKNSKIKVVFIYNTFFRKDFSFVTIDNFKSSYEIVEYLIKLGHKKIGMISIPFEISDRSHARWKGYKKCLEDHGFKYDQSIVEQKSFTVSDAKKSMLKLLTEYNPPTAIFCSNDLIAMGAMQAVREMGLKIPDDISIVGFDNMELSSYFYPPLTTVDQPANKIGNTAAEILIGMITGSIEKNKQVYLDHKIEYRSSCKNINDL